MALRDGLFLGTGFAAGTKGQRDGENDKQYVLRSTYNFWLKGKKKGRKSKFPAFEK